MYCEHTISPPQTRREMLLHCANGFGAVALGSLLHQEEQAHADQTSLRKKRANPLAAKQPHFPPKVKSVIYLYMDGGPSQVDTFDYKPMLEKHHGEDPRKAMGKLEPTQFNNIGKVMKSPWKFKQHGESGIWISELFPYIAKHADKLCVIKSAVSKFPEHTSANYFLHTGFGVQGRPSMGAWVGYGLGTENQNLPSFIVLNGGLIPPGGLDNFNSGFLPATFQGSIFNPSPNPIANIARKEPSEQHQKNKLALLKNLDEDSLNQYYGRNDKLESAIANYETAFRMQSAIPELTDLSQETKTTLQKYGFEAAKKQTQTFARQCLLARRLVERGVRFVELTCPGGNGDRWDQHGNLRDGHYKNALSVDQPIAALLEDLDDRGLLESTLIVWSGEFGRTPFAQGSNGRDHNPTAFSFWMTGGGLKQGITYGLTDIWGYKVIDKKVEIHDLHATMLHLLGLDHKKTTFRFNSRDMRLTDVHGNVLHDILT